MTDPTPAEIARRYTRRAFSVLRVAAGLGADAERAVGRLGTEIERLIVGAAVDELGRRDLAALLRDIDQRIAERFAIIAAEQIAAVREILAIEAAWASGVIGQGETAAAMLARMERDLLVLGARHGDQWARQGEALSRRIADAVREGAALGADGLRESIGDIAATARREAQQLADVSTTSAAGQAHAEVARAEGAVAFRWLSLLDSRTTTGCAIRHGLMYSLDYQPIGHSIPIERPPPRHWGCRSILAPWLRMPKPGDRDGEGTFDSWLATLSQAEQDDVLGKGRADLYRRKVITKADLVNQRGRVLTLAELRARGD